MDLECDLVSLSLAFLEFKVACENCIELDQLMTVRLDWTCIA
jgi:hypothetical protein